MCQNEAAGDLLVPDITATTSIPCHARWHFPTLHLFINKYLFANRLSRLGVHQWSRAPVTLVLKSRRCTKSLPKSGKL